jgi:hypothetical protein
LWLFSRPLTVKTLYEANLALRDLQPPDSFCDQKSPIYTRPRHLLPSQVHEAQIPHLIVGEGCWLDRCVVDHWVFGLRLRIEPDVSLKDAWLMGDDSSESPRQRLRTHRCRSRDDEPPVRCRAWTTTLAPCYCAVATCPWRHPTQPFLAFPLMRYSLFIQDSWGRTEVGSFEALQPAQEAFEALRQDRWCHDDGTVRGVLLVEQGAEGERLVASYRFQADG